MPESLTYSIGVIRVDGDLHMVGLGGNAPACAGPDGNADDSRVAEVLVAEAPAVLESGVCARCLWTWNVTAEQIAEEVAEFA